MTCQKCLRQSVCDCDKIKVGFWKDFPENYNYPGKIIYTEWPEASDTPIDPSLLSLLDRAEEQSKSIYYLGFSTCRLCLEKNGSTQHVFKNYTWPSGYRHYIIEHNVKMPNDFVEFLLNL